ncbi:MAG: DNA repair protein RadC [Clostridia bacterium]|nr:DNA repair protein RadC [Clostridia bacterium]
MPTVNRENLHKEHRKRVKERFLRSGLEDFAPHELLEMLLFYAIPQKDTNELGHRLIERFGSLSRVFHASYEELCEVEGIGDHAATLLRLWLPAAAYILTDNLNESKQRFNTVDKVGMYFINRYIGAKNETVYLMLLDNRFSMLDCIRVHEGSVNSVSITARRLLELALRSNAAMAVLAHNHPIGIAVPSSEDVGTTMALRDSFEAIGIPLLEHILVAGGEYTPILLRSERQLAESKRGTSFYANYTFPNEERLQKEQS